MIFNNKNILFALMTFFLLLFIKPIKKKIMKHEKKKARKLFITINPDIIKMSKRDAGNKSQ
jgi:hypothetical protein